VTLPADLSKRRRGIFEDTLTDAADSFKDLLTRPPSTPQTAAV